MQRICPCFISNLDSLLETSLICFKYFVVHKSEEFELLFHDEENEEYICRSAEGITLMLSVDENGNEKTRTEFTFSNSDEYFKKYSDEKSGLYYCSYDGSFQIR